MHRHHHHHHAHDQSSSRIGWAFVLNFSFTLIEFVGGLLTNSTAIMADAVHDLGDSLAIGMAWILNRLGERESNSVYTYGYRRFSLMGALINCVILIAGSLWVLSDAIPKLFEPEMPVVEGMLGLAILGIAVNGYAAYKLRKGKTLNERVLNWHLMEDVLGWVAVLIVSITLLFVDWPILDPALCIAFTLFILIHVFKTLKETLHLFLQAVPDKHLYESVKKFLIKLEGVKEVHHLHLWSLDGEHHVLTAHVVLEQTLDIPSQIVLKQSIAEKLKPFDLAHTTIEFEFNQELCRDARDG